MSDSILCAKYKDINNALFYLPRPRSNYDMVNNDYEKIRNILYNGCIYIPNLIAPKNDFVLFNEIIKELCLDDSDKLLNWSKHHKIENPENSKTFNDIVKMMADFFKIRVLQTRLNYYIDTDFKPFHHDSHAYTNGIKEDITIGCSLGSTRSLSFKKDEIYFEFPQYNGDVFCFDHETNLMFMHGVPKLRQKDPNNVRISIIVWGEKL
jgi:hypothetical protein